MQSLFNALHRFAIPIGVLAAAVAAVVLWPRSGPRNADAGGIWTCSMHPQIRMDHFDVCPICGMDLTPVGAEDSGDDLPPDQLALSERGRLMARIESTEIEARPLFHEIRTVGKIDFDETRMAQIASRVEGRVDQVFADFTGTMVQQGDHLVKIYSPDLVSTQEELLIAARRQGDSKGSNGAPSLAASARRRLQLWGVSDEQIEQILASGKAETHMVVNAPISGTVVDKMVRAGQYVEEGETLYTIADLTHVWLVVEVYESELSWVRFGQSVQVSLEADPAASFVGQVGFIEPVLNEQTRTVRARVILKNESGKLKPGMFAQALIRVGIMPDGAPAPTGLEGKFACPMHPYVLSDHEDTCSVCLMALERIPGEPSSLNGPSVVLAVPAEAVLTTGRRRLVYVELAPGEYQLVEPHLGPRAGDFYPVLHGLKTGDRVVTRGNFLLDSQFQITGRPSLFYPKGITGGSDHAHGQRSGSQSAKKAAALQATIERNLARLTPEDRSAAELQRNCPITQKPLGWMGVPVKVELRGKTVYLCCDGCTADALADPAAALQKLAKPESEAHEDKHGP